MFSFDSKVRYSECDEYGDLTLLSMINYLQDCSTFHSEYVGRGVQYMKDRGIGWLLASWNIEIVQLPRFCDDIRVSTWCHFISRNIATRNFTICDKTGTQLVRADSQWFIYDFINARLTRIPDDQDVYATDEPPLDMPPMERRIRTSGPYEEAPSILVGELHLDSNNHVNNAQYLGMATNAISFVLGPDHAMRSADIARILVQYRSQAFLGDTIIPRVQTDGLSYTVNLVNPDATSYAALRIVGRQ